MTISYAIPVCNEHEELDRLLLFLNKYIDEKDEIIFHYDDHIQKDLHQRYSKY